MHWDSVWELAKRHPNAVGGSIRALVLISWYLWGGSRSSTSGSGVYAYSADPNLVAQQTAEAVSANQTNAAVGITQSNNATAVSLAGLSVQQALNSDVYGLQATQSNNATAEALATTQAKSTYSTAALASLVAEQSGTRAVTGNGGSGGSMSAARSGQPIDTNYKPWLTWFGETMFGSSAGLADQGTFTGPSGEVVSSASLAKYLGWIGGSGTDAAGNSAASIDQSPSNPASIFYKPPVVRTPPSPRSPR